MVQPDAEFIQYKNDGEKMQPGEKCFFNKCFYSLYIKNASALC